MCEVNELLCGWGFEALVTIFEENGIDNESFLLLNDDNIKELIPNMGVRLKFEKKYKDYMTLEMQNKTSTSSEVLIVNHFSDLESGSDNLSESSSTITKDSFDLNYISSPMQNIINIDDFVSLEVPQKKRKENKEVLFENGLINYLGTTSEGRLIIRNKNSLNEYMRGKICKLIIDFLFLKYPDYKIPQRDFLNASREIQECFPTEHATIYFRAYEPKTNSNPKKQCCGKLWAKYTNARKIYNFLEKTGTVINPTQDEPSSVQEQISLDFVQKNLSPFEEVSLHWGLSFHARRKLLHETDLYQYMSMFPIIKQPDGCELLIKDFNQLYPKNDKNLFKKWNSLKQCILKLGIQKKILKNDDLFNDCIAIITLPLLFSPTTIRNGKKSWRPSKAEVARTFVIHLNVITELHEELNKIQTEAKRKDLTVQPFLVFVGPKSDQEGILAYISINEILYFVKDVVTALNTTFKIFFALEAKYPAECGHVWTYLQNHVYEIYTGQDLRSSAIEVFASEVSQCGI